MTIHRLTRLARSDQSDMLALAPYALPLKPTDGELKRWLADGAIALGLRSFGRLVGWAVVRPERANTWKIVCTATSPGFRMAATARRVLRYTIATIKAHEGRSLTIELGLDNSADGPRIADIAALCTRATGNVPEAVTIPGGTRLRIPLRNAADSVMPRPTFRAEALEQRILMSATWIDADGDALVGATEGDDIATGDDSADYIEGLGGNDQLFGGGGHDQLFGGDGDDLLRGGAGADLLDGGAGQDQADYSGAAGPVTVDLTTGHVSGADGDDTLVEVEGARGSVHDDVFAFSAPAPGATYSVDGGDGANEIDLSQFSLNDATFTEGRVTIHGAHGDFAINYAHINSMRFGDETVTVLDADVSADDFSGSGVFVDGDQVFRLRLDGSGHIDWSYDAANDALTISDIDGANANSTLSIEDLFGDDLTISNVTLDSDLGSLESNVDLQRLSIARTANVGQITIDDGHGRIDELHYTGGNVWTQPIEINASIGALTAQEFGANVTINGNVGSIDIVDDITIDGTFTINGDVDTFNLGDDIWNNADVVINGRVDTLAIGGDIEPGSTLTISGSAGTISARDVHGDVTISGDLDTFHAANITSLIRIGGVTGHFTLIDGDTTIERDYNQPHSVVYDGATKTLEILSVAPIAEAGADADGMQIDWFDDMIGPDGADPTFNDLATRFQSFTDGAEHTIGFDGLATREKLGTQYLDSHGVSFENTGGGQYHAHSGAHTEGDGNVEHITGYDGSYAADGDGVYLKFDNNDPNHPFTINFEQPVAEVGAMLAVGKEGPVHSVKITLFDADGIKIGEQIVEPRLWDATTSQQNHETFFGVRLDEARISRVEILNLSQTNFSNALLIDNLSWSHAPEAPANEITVNEGEVIRLSGAGYDPDSPNLSYEWTQTGGPTVTLDDPHAANPTFTAPEGAGQTDITFELRVSDGEHSSVDTVLIHVNAENDAPIAEGGSGATAIDTPLVLQLDATDIDTDVTMYRIDTLPAHGVLKLDGQVVQAGAEIDATRIADGGLLYEPADGFTGDITFEFSASDGEHWSESPASFSIHVDADNTAPLADAGADQVANEGDVITLSATGSADADGDGLTYTWRQVGGPTVELSDPNAIQPTFSAPDTREPTTLRFEVEVSDGDATRTDIVEIEVHDPTFDWVHSLSYNQFNQLAPDQVDYLSPEQVATIPDSYWFSRISPEARAELDADQVQALQVETVSIGYLTQDQRELLTPDQVDDLHYNQFGYLPASQVEHLTPEQISTIPDSYWFSRMSPEARAELDADQVQALQVETVSIGYLTEDQRKWLTPDQVDDLHYNQFGYLPASQVEHLTPEQISTIPDSYWFSRMSPEARAELDADQVQALQVETVSIGYLTEDQRELLTPDQVDDLHYNQFGYLPASQVEHLTPEQISTIPDSYWFSRMSPEARAELDADQVQALQVETVSIGYLTPDQREMLSINQVKSLSYSDFRYLSPNRIPDLTIEQISSIPDAYWFSRFDAAQRDALSHEQIRAINANVAGVTFVGASGNDTLSGNSNVNNMIGGDGNDVLAGGAGRDVLAGGAGNDTLDGGSGDDWLIAGGGDDHMLGGAGDDRFSFENPRDGDVVSVDGGDGRDTLDLRQFDAGQATIGDGVIVIDLGNGEQFKIVHTGIDAVAFSDGLYDAGIYNTPPIATGGSATMSEDGVGVITLRGVDFDTNDAIERFRIDAAPENGVLKLNGVVIKAGDEISVAQIADGALTFEPKDNWNGATTFTFSVSDGDDWSAVPAPFNIHVAPANDAPVGIGLGASLPEDGEAMISLVGVDIDAGDSVERFRIDSLPDGGVLTLNGRPLSAGDEITTAQLGEGGLKFTPSKDWHGSTSFRFSAFDGQAWSDESARFDLRVIPVNDAPDAIGGALTIDEDTTGVIDLAAFDIDEGDTIEAFRIDRLPSGGQLLLNGELVKVGQELSAADIADGLLTFVPSSNFNGDVDLLFSAYDGRDWSEPGVFSIHVTPVNDAPTVDADTSFEMPADTPFTLDPGVTDVDGDDTTIFWRQLDGPIVDLSDPHSATPTFTTPAVTEPTVLTFEVDISDGATTTTRVIEVLVTPAQTPATPEMAPTPPAAQPTPTPSAPDAPPDVNPDRGKPDANTPRASDTPAAPIAPQSDAPTQADADPFVTSETAADSATRASDDDRAQTPRTRNSGQGTDGDTRFIRDAETDEWQDVSDLEVMDATAAFGGVVMQSHDHDAEDRRTSDQHRLEAIREIVVNDTTFTPEPGEVRLDATYDVDEQIYFPRFQGDSLEAGFDEVETIRGATDPRTGQFIAEPDRMSEPPPGYQETQRPSPDGVTYGDREEEPVLAGAAAADGFFAKLWGLVRGFSGPRDASERDKGAK